MKNTFSYNSQQIINFKKLTLNLNIFVIIISVLVLIGWIFNIPILKSINPSWIAMRINTAFCFILSSISLFIYLIRDEIKNKKTGEFLSKLLAYITGLFGFLTICQYLSGMNFGIDTILSFENVSNLVEGALPQGRMAANTSLNFLLAGIALNLIYSNNIKIKKISQIISFFIILISLPALIGYCYGAQFEGSFAYFTHMALHTSVVFIALAIAIALSTSQFGYMSIFTKNDSGGVIARRLLPLVVVIPFLVDLLALSGYTQELYGFNYSMALAVIGCILFTGYVVFKNAIVVSSMESDLQESHLNLERTVNIRTSQFLEAQKLAKLGSWEWDQLNSLFDCSEELLRIFGHSNGESKLELQTYFSYCHPEDLENVQTHFKYFMENLGHFTFEHRIICKAGDIKSLRCQGELHVTVDGNAKMFGTVQDITLSKNLETELIKAKDQALAAVVAKSSFLSNMSHEIRTPMNAIIGMADLLNETTLSEDQKKFVSSLKRAGDNLLVLINDILDISKMEYHDLKIESIDFDLNEVVESAAELLAPKAHAKGLEIASHIRPDVPTSLVGDPHRLRQVLINLLTNAIKFTDKGEVLLRIENNHNHLNPGALIFSVIDTGIGIPQDKLDYLFERFTQADESVTRKYGGTGLGLSISKKIIELMKGEIQVSSIQGKGSNFSFTVQFGIHQNKAEDSFKNFNIQSMRTLIVDDNESDRLILVELLSSWGAITTDVENGELALEKLKSSLEKGSHPYDLLLLDQRMPGLSGFDVYSEILKISDYKNLVTMMITSDDRSQMIAKAHELGITNYLIKPVKKMDLRNSIAKATLKTKVYENKVAITPFESVRNKVEISMNILLVDDSEDNRMLILHYLKKTAHKIDIAEDGSIAVEKYKNFKYDLIFMDMQMPVMDGYTATKLIRIYEKESNLPIIPIVALTAYALNEDEEKSLNAGCSAHLTKPIKKQILLDCIADYNKTSF